MAATGNVTRSGFVGRGGLAVSEAAEAGLDDLEDQEGPPNP